MKTLLKTIIACLVIFQATAGFAQQFNTSQMDSSEQIKAYLFSLVRNNNADALNKHFNNQPWDTQAQIDVFIDSTNKASVSLFCVAVDLGNLDVVKAFVDHNYGPADLCVVKKFTPQGLNISKVERYFKNTANSSVSWFTAPNTDINSPQESVTKYPGIVPSNKTPVKTYYERPLNFASGEVFDYLFSKGFRSEQLLNKKALGEAKKLGKTEVADWILENAQKGEFAPLVDDDTFAMLVGYARQNKDSLAYQALANGTLKVYKTSTEAKNASKELENKLKEMETNMQIKSPSDTLGYSDMQQQIKAKEAELAKKEAKIDKLRTDDLSKVLDLCKNEVNTICQKGSTEKTVYCTRGYSYGDKYTDSHYFCRCSFSEYPDVKFPNGDYSYTIHCK